MTTPVQAPGETPTVTVGDVPAGWRGRAVRVAVRLGGVMPRGAFGRGVLTLVTGTGIAQLIVIATSPILTRLYPPAAYGVFAVATSIMSILITVTCLRFEFAIPLPESDDGAANVLALALLVNVGVSVVAGLVLWLTSASLLPLFGAAALAPYIAFVTLGQLGGGTVSALTNWAVRTRSFADIAATRMTQAISLVVVQLGLGAAGFGAPGLLLGDVAGRVGGSSRLARGAWRTHASSLRRVRPAGILAAASRYRRFAILSSPSAVLNALGLQAPLLLLVACYGTQAGGQFALADRVCSLPLTLIAGAVGQVYLAEAAQQAREQPAALQNLFRRTTWSLARMAILPAVLLAVAAPVFAGLVFGASWSEMGLFVAVLAPMYFTAFVMTATGDTLYVLERQDLQLVREVFRLGLLGGSIPVAAALGLPVLAAVTLLSVAGSLTYLVYGLVSWRAIVTNVAHPHSTDVAVIERGGTTGDEP